MKNENSFRVVAIRLDGSTVVIADGCGREAAEKVVTLSRIDSDYKQVRIEAQSQVKVT